MKFYINVIKFNFFYLFIFVFLVAICISTIFYNTVSATEAQGIELPIIMYHSILKDKSKSGKYILSPSDLEEDFIYIKEHGYNTITMSQLIDYVYDDIPLPEKPIIITFDDGYYNNYAYVYPLLEKYNMKAVISVVGKYTDTYTESNEANPNYGYLRWCDINILMASGYVEFQNHTYDMHGSSGRNGSTKKWNESFQAYSNNFTQDILKLQNLFKQNTNYIPNTYTYPFGAISKSSTELVKNMGFKASLSCNSGINFIVKNPDCLYLLKRNNRPSGVTTEKFFSKLLF